MLQFGSSANEINKYLNTFILNHHKNKDIIDSFNKEILIGPIIIGLLLLIVFILVYKKYGRINYANYDPDKFETYENNYKGFKGFLLLFAILIIVLNPISSVMNILSNKFCYSSLIWTVTTIKGSSEYSSWWDSVLKIIPVLDSIELMFSIFLAFLLVKKKRLFRYVFFTFLFFEIMNFGLKDIYYSQIFPIGSLVKVNSIDSLSIIYQVALIFGFYVYFSKSIHATLRK